MSHEQNLTPAQIAMLESVSQRLLEGDVSIAINKRMDTFATNEYPLLGRYGYVLTRFGKYSVSFSGYRRFDAAIERANIPHHLATSVARGVATVDLCPLRQGDYDTIQAFFAGLTEEFNFYPLSKAKPWDVTGCGILSFTYYTNPRIRNNKFWNPDGIS
ncbi:MAG: hypothetical protein AAB874_03930 [Patescibacteria group bacterium]